MDKESCPYKVTLELPSWELHESYVECLKDFHRADPSRTIKWEWFENFQLYLDWCASEREEVDVIGERVQQTSYWIVCDDTIAVGKFSIRHKLTPQLEKLGGHFGYEIRPAYQKKGIGTLAIAAGLEKARELGLAEIIVTCDTDNLGSVGVLENNGGRLVGTYEVANWPKLVNKYIFK